MRLRELRLQNFRCFDAEGATIRFDEFTALVGTNSAGKSAVLQALAKLFGPRSKERWLERTDFHSAKGLAHGADRSSELELEAVLELPELADEDGNDPIVPEVFSQMVADEEGGVPYVRLRLTATWSQGTSIEGEIVDRLVFVTSPLGTPREDEDTRAAHRAQLGHVEFIYVPALRDPVVQLRRSASSLLWRVLSAVEWPTDLPEKIRSVGTQLDALLAGVQGVKAVREVLSRHWESFHHDARYSNLHLQVATEDLESLLERAEIEFRSHSGDSRFTVAQLGDGLRSLFYVSLVTSLLEVQHELRTAPTASKMGLDPTRRTLPAMTIVGLEEPENHLAPHVLGTCIENLVQACTRGDAQVIVSSHTASLMRRVNPERVRHLRLEPARMATVVSELQLPESTDEAYTFVKEAVQAYPELYFARAIVLGEGDSEEVVLPKLIAARGGNLDRDHVSVVPLGGRHVNHFWRLLDQLAIPYVTLLDLDTGRGGGGAARLRYVLRQLQLRADRTGDGEVLVDSARGTIVSLDELLTGLDMAVDEGAVVDTIIPILETQRVFFSAPLDLDYAMLRAFPSAYLASVEEGRGPRHAKPEPDPAAHQKALTEAALAVLGEDAASAPYDAPSRRAFLWYRYLFLHRSKPVTHLMALKAVKPADLAAQAPAFLQRLVDALELIVHRSPDGECEAE